MSTFWNNEVMGITNEYEGVNVVRLDSEEKMEVLLEENYDEEFHLIINSVRNSPRLIDSLGGDYDLRDGHMLYLLNNGMVGFGVRGQQHLIRPVAFNKRFNNVMIRSEIVLKDIINTSDRNVKAIRDRINVINGNDLNNCKVDTIIYFED